MKSASSNRTTPVCNVLCAALALVLLVCQFLPFWTVESEEGASEVSIQSFIWFPYRHADLEAQLAEATGDEDFSAGSALAMPVLVLLCGAASVALCLIKHSSAVASALPAACGLAGAWGFLAEPAFQLGNAWQVQLALSAAMLALAALSIVSGIRAARAQRASGESHSI